MKGNTFKTAHRVSSYLIAQDFGFSQIKRTLDRISSIKRFSSPFCLELYQAAAPEISCLARGKIMALNVIINPFQYHP
jgi:hypothetical protein